MNIPVILWSTPFSFYNNRLEILAAFPLAHIDGLGLDHVGAVTQALGPILGHDFGNGLTGGISADVELGGLLGYDFGRFTLTGSVTRSLIERNLVGAIYGPQETRGWLRLILPIYVAPTAPVVARY